MTTSVERHPRVALWREAVSTLLFGGWEVGLLVIMALLYLGGLYLNPAFFGSHRGAVLGSARRVALWRDGGRHDLRHRQQGARPVGRLDLRPDGDDLRHGVRADLFRPGRRTAVFWCLVLGLAIGLINGILVTVLEVPAFIATLTMLFIGRGVILGLTGGKNIAFEIKAARRPVFRLGEINAFGFNNQIVLFVLIAAVGAVTARLYVDRLDDLCDRRQRAGRALRRHQHPLGSHALLHSVLALRGHRRTDECRAEQGRRPAIRARRGIDRDRVGDCGRRGDFRRARADHRLVSRRHSDRPDRQGAARRRADHAHHRRRRREDGSRRASRNCRRAPCRPFSASCSSRRC